MNVVRNGPALCYIPETVVVVAMYVSPLTRVCYRYMYMPFTPSRRAGRATRAARPHAAPSVFFFDHGLRYNVMPMRQGLKSTGDENLRSFHGGEEPEKGLLTKKMTLFCWGCLISSQTYIIAKRVFFLG